jgi:hypothetical protein
MPVPEYPAVYCSITAAFASTGDMKPYSFGISEVKKDG